MTCPECGEPLYCAGTQWADEFVWVCLDGCEIE